MPLPEILVAAVMLASLIVYALSGGADFGGGVWDLLATGPRAQRQRRLITESMAPIWEANHVWMILVVVLMFVGFPRAFAAMGTALHIPLTLTLFGIVLRGSAFAFKSYGTGPAVRRWGLVFSVSSLITPLFLGITVGGIVSSSIPVDLATGQVGVDFWSAWLAPFPLALGGFALALFSFIAAVYLTNQTADPELQEDFRLRALGAGVLTGALAFGSLYLAVDGAPLVLVGLVHAWWALPFHLVTAVASFGALVALVARRYRLARAAMFVQVVLVFMGWGWAKLPFILPPDLTLDNSSAPDVVLWMVLGLLAVGGLFLVPAFVWLYRVFRAADPEDRPAGLTEKLLG